MIFALPEAVKREYVKMPRQIKNELIYISGLNNEAEEKGHISDQDAFFWELVGRWILKSSQRKDDSEVVEGLNKLFDQLDQVAK